MRPFQQLQIVEIAGSQAGAFAAKLFADYGARVVKIEPPGGDPLRKNGEEWQGVGTEWAYLNTGKRSLTLDLADDGGREALAELLERSDAVIESSAPDPLTPVTGEFGDERLVRAYVSPFGLSGPYCGYRSNVFTDDAIGGHMGLSGDPGREPIRREGLHTHFQAAMHTFIGTVAALLARERTGRGQVVEVSHFEGMAALHQHTISAWNFGGHILRRQGNTQPGPWHPVGVYPTKDGYVFLGHSTGAKLIPFVEVLGLGHLFDDPRFATDGMRGGHKREFDAAIGPRLLELTTEEIIDLGRSVFSPIGPVPTMLEVLEDEQYSARDFWVRLPGEPSAKVPRGPFLIEGHQAEPKAPPLVEGGTSIEELLKDWDLRAAGSASGESSTSAPEKAGPSGPLDGVRVLDLTRVWAGPIAGRLLADLGADVIHIESPWNRGLQAVEPEMAALTHLYPEDEVGERPWNRSAGVNKLARNKRGVTLNLQDERGRAIFAELVQKSDVVLENYSPRVMPSLGFDFESMKKLKPSIVYTAMPGYGSTGPGRGRVALGPVIEAAVGLTQMMGYRDSGPYRSGVAWADPVSGMSAVAGTLVGLWDRDAADGVAQRVETAMSESMAASVGEELLAAQVRGTNAPRLGNRDPKNSPQGVYPCAGTDRWVAISVTSEAEWKAVCNLMGLEPALSALSQGERYERHDEIDAAIGAWTRGHAPRSAMQRLQEAGVIAVQVSDGRDLAEDPQLEARNWWAEHDHADVGHRRWPGSPLRLSETPITFRYAPPGLGQHNDEVYGGLLGMSSKELAALRKDRVIVDKPPATLEETSTRGNVSRAY